MIREIKIRMVMLTVLTLLSAQATGCGVSQRNAPSQQVIAPVVEEAENISTDNTDIDQAAQHLLTVWSDYMDVYEKLCASELWALAYVDAYLESGDWEDLSKARTACIASVRYLSELSMTEDDLSEEEYLILANAGIDTSYQTVEFLSVPVFVDEAHNFIRNQMLERLECDVYSERSIESLKERADVEREAISVMCRRSCIDTNYLLLTLGDDATSKSYWSSMQEKYPILTSERGEWLVSEAELKVAADACMDVYEDIVLRQAEMVSMADAQLYQVTQDIENEDWDAFRASAHTMSNVPDFLPFPTWYNPDTAGYLSVIIGEDGSVTYPESGDNLTDSRYGVYIQIEKVGAEEIAAYVDTVKSYALDVWKSGDTGSWYIRMPDYNVKIDCENDTTTILFIGEDVTFVPVWYIW